MAERERGIDDEFPFGVRNNNFRVRVLSATDDRLCWYFFEKKFDIEDRAALIVTNFCLDADFGCSEVAIFNELGRSSGQLPLNGHLLLDSRCPTIYLRSCSEYKIPTKSSGTQISSQPCQSVIIRAGDRVGSLSFNLACDGDECICGTRERENWALCRGEIQTLKKVDDVQGLLYKKDSSSVSLEEIVPECFWLVEWCLAHDVRLYALWPGKIPQDNTTTLRHSLASKASTLPRAISSLNGAFASGNKEINKKSPTWRNRLLSGCWEYVEGISSRKKVCEQSSCWQRWGCLYRAIFDWYGEKWACDEGRGWDKQDWGPSVRSMVADADKWLFGAMKHNILKDWIGWLLWESLWRTFFWTQPRSPLVLELTLRRGRDEVGSDSALEEWDKNRSAGDWNKLSCCLMLEGWLSVESGRFSIHRARILPGQRGSARISRQLKTARCKSLLLLRRVFL